MRMPSWRDNVFVERLWKSIKYEDIYLRAYDTVSAVKRGISGAILVFIIADGHTSRLTKFRQIGFTMTTCKSRKWRRR